MEKARKRYWVLTIEDTLYKIDTWSKAALDVYLSGKPVIFHYKTYKRYLDGGKKLAGYVQLD